MNKLIEHIQNKDFDAANKVLEEQITLILEQKLLEMKKMCAANEETGLLRAIKKPLAQRLKKLKKPVVMANGSAAARPLEEELDSEDLTEEELLEARIKIIKARIRGGVIQRRKKVATVPGMTMRGGKLIRMTASERRRRRLGAKRGKIKRRGKKSQMLRKRKLSIMKRKRLGL
jgi:tRNA A37 threonylcarbamoyladenosine synthetase subunit TsaC/SUA5/YrdC